MKKELLLPTVFALVFYTATCLAAAGEPGDNLTGGRWRSRVAELRDGSAPKAKAGITGSGQNWGQPVNFIQANTRLLPEDYRSITIEGPANISPVQAIAFLKKYAADFKTAVSVEQLVALYYEESAREGIRGDLALCQALLETGFFRFGGTVKPEQNNFCGLGTTGKTVAGAYFATPELGVRAHIQHLLAYTSNRKPATPIVDPRYALVRDIRERKGDLTTWYALNGNWAMGSEYSEKIFALYGKMATAPLENSP